MNLFVYGTLRSHFLAKSLLGREVTYIPGTLTGYKIGHWGSYLILHPSNESLNVVLGDVITGLSRKDIEILDSYEGIPWSPYKRVEVVVETVTDKMDCFTYASS